MKTDTEPSVYAVLEVNVCQHCQRAIERRRILGWVHVVGFYSCRRSTADGTFNEALPK